MSQLTPSTTPIRTFEDHESAVDAVAVFPDKRRMITGSDDKTLRLWDLEIGVVLKKMEGHGRKILDITTARDACLTEDLSTAEELLTQEIHTNADDFTSYANRSFVMARKHDLDHALEDAIKSINIRPSLTGCISKGIALCGKGHVREARVAFDVHSIRLPRYLLHPVFQVIALFNTDQHEEAMLLIKDLAAAYPNIDPLTRRVVETYLCESKLLMTCDHLTAVVNSGAVSSKYIHFQYQDLTVLFGWDLESLLLMTHQKRCQAFLSTEIPGQDHDGYDAEPNFYGMHQYSQISGPRLEQRAGRLKRLRLAMTKRPESVPAPRPKPGPGPGPGPPPTSPPVTATTTTFKLTYDAYLPYHSIMQHHLLLTFLSLKVDSVMQQRVLLGVSTP
ncbi:uncharacterized protein F5891DRAFT_1282058 [Suillus fuscotomentosus]|uniref:Uncharacterized protein n=1 Tax=Suillus fuscotomentosus TaxID=1912939 RepID=A0AAD4HFE8_9AGAM|nr:uncharacterized protein F5891DRAFT_1282058 [Suillus fuscotomentosus]KAG1893489.1 hypothetical protein F5891DRAFT_1282058 [Suillus fuscotomentosus]